MKEQIRNFIMNELLEDNTIEWNDDTDIISSGVIDSLSIVRLLVFVEDTYNISLDDSLELEYFKSVNAIANMVSRKVSNI